MDEDLKMNLMTNNKWEYMHLKDKKFELIH